MPLVLDGELTLLNVFDGELNDILEFDGELGIITQVTGTEYPWYTGDTEVIPRAHSAVVLETANKIMPSDVTVIKIPYYETSNQSGKTVYIADEV